MSFLNNYSSGHLSLSNLLLPTKPALVQILTLSKYHARPLSGTHTVTLGPESNMDYTCVACLCNILTQLLLRKWQRQNIVTNDLCQTYIIPVVKSQPCSEILGVTIAVGRENAGEELCKP